MRRGVSFAMATTTVTSNDRVFTCTLDSCQNEFRRSTPGFGGVGGGSISIRACFLDVDRLRENLYTAMNRVGAELAQFRGWLNRREQEFELKFLAGGGSATTDQTTFNKVNVTLSRLRKQMDLLTRWYSEFQERVANALDTLGSYTETMSMLRTFAPTETSGGLPPNPIVLARRNITRAKAIQRQTNLLARTETRLNTMMMGIQRQLDSFSQGIVRVNGRNVNLPEMGNLIGQLSGDGSPLERVQLMIANANNSLKQVYTVGTERSGDGLAIRVAEQPHFRQLLPGSDATMDDLLNYLRTLSVSALYTDNTKSSLEAAIAYVRDRALKDRLPSRDENGVPTGNTVPNPATLAAVDRYASRIRGSLPGRVIERYRAATRDRQGIYLRLSRLHELIRNVQPGDEIYKRELQDIYDETYDVLESDLTGGSGASTTSGGTDYPAGDTNFSATGGGSGGNVRRGSKRQRSPSATAFGRRVVTRNTDGTEDSDGEGGSTDTGTAANAAAAPTTTTTTTLGSTTLSTNAPLAATQAASGRDTAASNSSATSYASDSSYTSSSATSRSLSRGSSASRPPSELALNAEVAAAFAPVGGRRQPGTLLAPITEETTLSLAGVGSGESVA